MKKLLYISVNSKPEQMSASKTVARDLINQLNERSDYIVDELDLYRDHIPRLEYQFFESKNCLIKEDAFKQLSDDQQKEAHQIIKLCDQFKEADVVVVASPMWSLSFPAPLKEYMDCILQVGKTITFENHIPKGLLDDKKRTVVYVQSSGGHIPYILRPLFNKGLNYIEDMMKFMGISQFKELLVDGTGLTDVERTEAIKKATEKIPDIIKHI